MMQMDFPAATDRRTLAFAGAAGVAGFAVYAAPNVKPGEYFIYFDPIDQLSTQAQSRWEDGPTQGAMVAEAVRQAGAHGRYVPA